DAGAADRRRLSRARWQGSACDRIRAPEAELGSGASPLASAATSGARSVPLRKLDGDALGAVEEDQLATMKIQGRAAGGKAAVGHLLERRIEILHGKADMVETDPPQVARIALEHGLGPVEAQELDFGAGLHPLGHQRHVVGLELLEAEVASEGLALDDDGDRLLETQDPEEALRLAEIAHDDGHMVETTD